MSPGISIDSCRPLLMTACTWSGAPDGIIRWPLP